VSRMARRASLALLMLAALSLGAMALSGCTSTAQIEAEQRDECYATQARIQAEMDQVHRAKGAYPDIGTLVTRLNVKCPTGGTYEFDPVAEKVLCTKHGSKPAPKPAPKLAPAPTPTQ
jgi:hypothetical protein